MRITNGYFEECQGVITNQSLPSEQEKPKAVGLALALVIAVHNSA
jgi:hypothetical protein